MQNYNPEEAAATIFFGI